MSAQGNAGRGAAGEDIAEKYLEKHGYRVIARDYSIARGEIDIAACRRGTVVIAEVKTRSGYRFGRAAEAVDEVKQQRLRRAADAFLRRHTLRGRIPVYSRLLRRQVGRKYSRVRFDIIEVYTTGGRPTVNHMKNAF